ncbi:MAG: dipeptidase [Planctomycetaceae bacterium]|nr:dipeptidase [Planctomycetaceae bacterium]
MNDSEIQAVLRALEENRSHRVGQLQELLRIPSVSADSRHHGDCRAAAQWVLAHLAASGCDAELVETAGLPIIYAEWTQAEGAPTALIYGHYDVQPPDPLDEWTTPAFEPTIRDGCLFARGATDDKGQVFTHMASIAAWLKTVGRLPVNVKVVIEGEEEVGSNNLERFLADQKKRLACDVAVVSDTAQYGNGIPAITYGLRGILACEVTVHGPRQDLHSGVFGGAVANPANVLCQLISRLHDSHGRIQIPGFYDAVVPLTDEERSAFAALPFDESAYCASLGIDALTGEVGYSTLERRWARPTCDVNGIFGGYQGEGPKTIVPARATAKITCRLVPHQDPVKLTQALEQFLRSQCPSGVRMEFRSYHGAPAVLCDTSSPYMAAARQAVEAGFGQPPVMIREGGTIPVVSSFKQILGVDTLLLGWGRNSDNLHSPNEHFHLDDFHHGTTASAHLWAALGA